MASLLSQWTEPDRLIPVFGAIFFVGGLGICAWGRWMVARARSWHSTTGHVLSGSIDSERTGSAGEGGGRVFVAKIVYTYTVGGRPYQSRRVAVGGQLNTSSRTRAERTLERYPAGSAVEVFYNPRDPARACLERRTEVLGMGCLFAAVGVCVLLCTSL